jgi:hypothetical protein
MGWLKARVSVQLDRLTDLPGGRERLEPSNFAAKRGDEYFVDGVEATASSWLMRRARYVARGSTGWLFISLAERVSGIEFPSPLLKRREL